MYEFTIHGTRGTLAACGAEYLGYGGNTTCFSMRSDRGWLIIDAGSGISHISEHLRGMHNPPPITILFTHFHIDHVIGLPCFEPLYRSQTDMSIYADPCRQVPWRDCLRTFMGKPFWPVGLGEAPAHARLIDLPRKDECMDIFGMHVTWCDVPHPQQCVAYRIDVPGWSVVVATDVEFQGQEELPGAFRAFSRNADYALIDAQFTPEEYEHHRGWGHGTWKTAVAAVQQCNVKQAVLIHHAPERSDAEIRNIQDIARRTCPNVIAGAQGMSWSGPA